MKDRQPTPGMEGRVLITPEDTSIAPFYARLAMADNALDDGTPMIAATFLKDPTAALYGLADTAVPDDVLALLHTQVTNAQASADGKAKFQTGSYVGVNSAATITITTGFKPKAAIICASDYGIYASGGSAAAYVSGVLLWAEGVSTAAVATYNGTVNPTATFTQNEDGLSIDFNAGTNMNYSSTTYHYIVFG